MALNNLGVILKRLGDLDGAVDCYRQALAAEPDDPETHNNLGNALECIGRAGEAVTHCRRAVTLRPDFVEAHNNLGVALSGAGRPDDGDAAFVEAMALKPDFTEARFNHAVTRLLLGDFERGWQAYESRFDRADWTHIHPHRYDRPRWRGEPFPGRRLYVHDEQGFGDAIQFVRYLPRVKSLGGTVILETRAPLIPLLAGMAGVDEVVLRPAKPEPAADCDLVVPLMSLAGVFGTTADTVPAPIPYLNADRQRVARWRRTVGDDGLRIGLVWAGSPSHEQDNRRSCPLNVFSPLANVPGVRLFGLQKEPAAVAAATAAFLEANLGEAFDDFADTAAAMAAMDLVISVDTAAAHLAGAMGIPAWVLLPRAPDWRWQLGREDSPWYPGLRLFRQGQDGAWEPLIARVAAAVAALAQQRSTSTNIDPADSLQDALRLFRAGRLGRARDILASHLSLHPNDARARNLAAAVEFQDNRLLDALGHADIAAAVHSDNADIQVNRGRILAVLGRSEAAARVFEGVLSHRPGHREAQLGLADILADSDRPETALGLLERLVAENASDTAARLRLCRLLRSSGGAEEAVRICREGILRAPGDPALQVAMGLALAASGRTDDAQTVFDDALARDPGNTEALHNLGVLHMRAGRFEAAEAVFERTAELDPDHADARFNLAQIQLLNGRFDTGWAGYQWRMKKDGWRRRYPMGAGHRRWDGSPFPGRRLCVRHEQGLGDTLQFVRYLSLVKALGGSVVLEAAPALHNLLHGMTGVDQLTAPAADRLPPGDCELVAPLMSLPQLLDARGDALPGTVPYIHAPDASVRIWKGRIPDGGGLSAGLVWAGNPVHANDANRSIPLTAMAPALAAGGVRWVGLQYGGRAVDIYQLPVHLRFENLGGDFADFTDTAACIANLDLVVTVDTAIAHLAGAMGKPVWVLLPFVPDWRWLRERGDSPWYPTMRLFRQTRPGDWQGVVARVARALAEAAAHKARKVS